MKWGGKRKLWSWPYVTNRHKEDVMCVQNKFNSLSNQNLSSCSLGSFFSLSSLSARWFSHTFTHSNVIKAPIRAPNTGLSQNSSERNIFETVLSKSFTESARSHHDVQVCCSDMARIIAVFIARYPHFADSPEVPWNLIGSRDHT